MARRSVFKGRKASTGLVCASVLWLVACAEPVDCALEPQRCPNRQPATHVAHPPPTVAREQARVAVPMNNGQRLLQVPDDRNAPGRPPSREPLAAAVHPIGLPEAPLPPGAPTREEVKALVAQVKAPAQARDFEGFKAFITQRLYGTLTPLLIKDSDRLWRHLDKYVAANARGFRTEVDSVETDRVQLHLSLQDGTEMRPILVRQNGVWAIDRF